MISLENKNLSVIDVAHDLLSLSYCIMNMKTGFDNTSSENDPLLLFKIKVMMKTLLEQAVITGTKYAKEAGRSNLSSTDMIYALQYQGHHFAETQDLEERVEYWTRHNEEEDDAETDDDTEESDEDSDDDTNEKETVDDNECFTRATESSFAIEVNRINDSWDSWNPTDLTQLMIKNSIDKVKKQFIIV